MDFELNMKQAVIRRTARKYAEKRLTAAAVEMDRTGTFPLNIAEEMGKLNYFGLEIPTKYQGAGLDPLSYAIVVEEVSRVNSAMGLCIAVHNGVSAAPIYQYGNKDQHQEFLVPMATGIKIGTFCLTEPNAGSDPSSIESTAIRVGDEYILNGNKMFVTNGGISGINLIFAKLQQGKMKGRLTAFIVESDRPGLKKGVSEDLMGNRGNPVCPISFYDCHIPAINRLGKEGEGFKIAIETLRGGRIGIASQALGIAQAAFDLSLKYSRERYQFGKPIASFGAIQNFLADMATDIEAARLLIYRTCNLRGKGMEHLKESAMAKMFASEVAVKTTKIGVQIHGGYGYTKSYTIERLYRDAKICEIYEGSSEIQRIVIANNLIN